jgi:hypothetical protein
MAKKYIHTFQLKITNQQFDSLKTLKKYGVNPSQFIRIAVKDKLQKEWKQIKKSKNECPF